jgi:hypothetical protein|tara:strand:- start:232 stop:675 length:444 start_codon:yes stop_codon:yes gene_type:complete
MKLEELLDSWKTDCKIDDTDLDKESLDIPLLHGKYLKYYYQEKLKLRSLRIKCKTLSKTLGEYYRGELNNPEDLNELNREPWPKVVLKQEIGNYVDADKEMVSLLSKIAYQEELVGCCEDILKNINNRGFQIRAAIDWRRLTQFGGT